MFKRPSVLYVLIAIAALAVGLLVYLFDRRPEHVYFLSHGFALAHALYSLFGVVGNYLPTFVHVYAFILLTVAVAGSTQARLIGICAAWFVIAALFECAQLPAIAGSIAVALPAWFARVPILDNTAAYFLDGTFDVLDLLSIVLGTAAAYFTVALTRNGATARALTGELCRAWRYLALSGITLLGMLSIIGSGGGSSTPDTTPPTVSSTYPLDAATGVFIENAISITFSETMNAATINTATFTLEDSVHIPVLATVSYAGNTATLTPINPLAQNTVYIATVTTGAKDLAGNALAADHSWNFTTEGDAWQTTTTSSAPTARIKHVAVWTGSKMIVWGGQDSGGVVNSGGVYDPVADTWSVSTTSSAPTARLRHTAIWDNNDARMIVWGGWNGSTYFNTGAAYDPATDAWSPIATPSSFAGRVNHTAVWTGSEMIVWGGTDGSNFFNNGAAYDPALNNWRPIANPPTGFLGRSNHTAVWTGKEMIVWGGTTNSGVVNSGAAYDPATDTWRLISTSGAPVPRLDHTALWTGPTGISMVIWGGLDFGTAFNDGGRYDPATDSWKATDSTSNVPTGRFDHTAVWTGSEMIVWGGNDISSIKTNTGGRYTP